MTDEESAAGVPGTLPSLFDDAVRPAFERLVAQGRIASCGVTGTGSPAAVIEVLRGPWPPAAVQCVTNLLDSPGSMQRFEGRTTTARDHRRGPRGRGWRHGAV